MQAYTTPISTYRLVPSPQSVAHLCLMPALLLDLVLRLLPLVCVLHPRGDGADLDLLERRGEVRIERERVVGIDVPPGWVLLEDLILRAGK